MNALRRLLAAAVLVAGISSTAGPDPDTDAVMRVKLAAAQRILGGIALADYASVKTNAATLVTLSGQRGWAALQTPDYELFTTRFRLAAEAVGDAAGKKDLAAVTRAYHELTLSCVSCHTYLRDSPQKSGKSK